MNIHQYATSLNIFARHLCCEGARLCLFPPRKGGKLGDTILHPIPAWIIDVGDGGAVVEVQFCPFCGEKLEVRE